MKFDAINNDSDLLKSITHGCEQSFTILFNRYSEQLYYVSLKYNGSEEDAKDIVQEVFTKIWCFRKRLKPDKPIAPYIIKIAKNTIYNRSKRRLVELTYLKHQTYLRNGGQKATEEHVLVRELEYLVKSEVNQMPKKRKEIFIMSRERGMSNREIAIKLNISTSTVENQINKGLHNLRKKLKYSSYTNHENNTFELQKSG